MTFLQRLLRRTPPSDPATTSEPTGRRANDMRDVPIDNPLDYRADGSIREGDPAWALVELLQNSGGPVSGRQRADGTWQLTSRADERRST